MTADLLILIGFLLLNVIVGFRYRGKSKSFREYAIGDKKFSTATLTATVVATWVSGSALFICLEETYSRGLYFLIAIVVGGSIGQLLTSCVFAPRVGKFQNNVSVPESLGQLYGKTTQIVAGVSSVLISIGYIAIQFQVIARILEILFSYDHTTTVVITAMIVTLYSLFGGVKAVTFTDVLQLFTFGTVIPVLALAVWNNLDDTHQVVQMLSINPHFNLREVLKWSPEWRKMISFMSYVMIPTLAPGLFQRMVIARDASQAKKSMLYASLIMQAIILCLAGIAILLLADQPGLTQDQVVKYMVDTHVYPGLKGLLGVGVIALSMSTADSTINSTAVVIANDILSPLQHQQKGSIKMAKYATLLLGGFSVFLALRVPSLLDIILLSACFYSPIVTVPMMLAILGFETSRRVVYMAMGAGVATVAACLFHFKTLDGFLPGMLANLATMLGAHYWLKEEGGWGNNPVTGNIKYLEHKSWIRSLKIFDLPTYLSHALPVTTHFYSFFGFYIFTATYTSFFLLPKVITLQFPLLYGSMQYSVLILSTTFLAFPIWPEKLKKKHFMTWIWPLSIFYTCFVVGSILVVLSGFSIPHMLILMLNLVMAALLLHWPIAVIMAFIGLFTALFVFKSHLNLIYPLDALNTLQFKIAYILLLCSSFLLALFKHKQSYQDIQERNLLLRTTQKETSNALLQALKHREQLGQVMRDESMSMFTSVQEISEKLEKETHRLRDVQATTAAQETIQQAKVKIKAAATYFGQIIYQLSAYMRLHVSTISLKKLIKASLKDLKYKLDPSSSSQIIVQHNTQQSHIECDAKAIQKIVVDGLDYAQQHTRDQQPILLGITDTALGYPITAVPGYTKKVAALCITITTARTLPIPLTLYVGALSTPGLSLLKASQALPIIQNERIVEEHYGAVEFVENKHDCTQIYVIPLHLREVRPETMDAPDMDVNAPTVSHDLPVYPQEEEILKTIAMYPEIDRAIVQKAVQLIKTYHAGVKRKSGEPFYLHPIAVAQILLKYTKDQDTIIAALLHDTVEDTSLSLSQIEGLFNETVQRLVDGVTHLESNMKTHKRIQLSTHENILQLLGVKDERILYIKLADRLHNMRTIKGHPSLAKQKKIAEETLHFFVPIARHIKLHAISEELQQLSSEVLSRVS